jgi:environmental stress-induced protein Ves
MLHLRREQYRSMPWRNGKGVTQEIAREPREGDDFHWRLSLATVASNGPFSSYAGYRRSVSLIDGEGFQLGIDGQDPVVLDWFGATLLFPGDAPTHCTLINGPATDLSLMVREPGAIISVIRIRDIAAPAVLPLDPVALKAVFCLRGAIVLAHADDSMTCNDSRTQTRSQIQLALHDTVLLDRQATSVSLTPSPGMSADLLLLTWTPASTRPA